MTFDEILGQAIEMLQRRGRVSYGALKRQFELDDEYLADLKVELIEVLAVAADQDGKMLVWAGTPSEQRASNGEQPQAEKVAFSGPTPAAPATEAERRQLTVLFCDLVGSTALSAQLDPEDYRAIVQQYQQTCTEVIQRYEGHLAQYLGDGLLVYFGYPTAHEDDAARAVRVGLGIVEAVHALQTHLTRPLQVRIGIHTGVVVVGEIGGGEKRELLALGETPNLAARIQGLAEPDTVVTSGATSRLVQGLFECQERGPQELKGLSAPLSLYRVLRESEAQSRFEVAVGIGLTPLIGRDLEVGLLRARWIQAKGGEGQVVLLSGEAGIGKSRLVQTLKEQVLAEGATRIEFRCSPYHRNSAFYPIIEHLQRLLQFAREDTPQTKLTKLQHALMASRFPQADTLPLLAALLSLPQPEGLPPLTLSSQKQKQRTQEALVAWIGEEGEKAAVYCAWEDLHWADPSTLEFLTLFLEQIPTARLLAVLTFRPDFTPPWRSRSHIAQLTLNRLGRRRVEAMVENITGGKPLPWGVVQQIVAKTDGVPLFVEELTKTVVESGLLTVADDHYELAGPLPPLAIPSTLQDSLMARLDRLGTTREIAQVGATLGREFSYEVLHAVSHLEEGLLQQGLRQLVEAELLYQRGLPPQARYLFKHALVQDAAYQSLLKSKRQQLHQQIAQVLEERFPETTETQPELLAHHYTEAELIAHAIPYWQKAGERASQRSAYVEAISHLTKGLEVLKTTPDTPERTEQELDLQITLGPALIATKGYAAPEVERTYARARELCIQGGNALQLFSALYGMWWFHFVAAKLQTAREQAEELLRLAQRQADPVLLLTAHRALGYTLYDLGELAPACAQLEAGIALYDPQLHQQASRYGGTDPGVGCLCFVAMALWYRGYVDQARGRMHEALTLAQDLAHPLSQCAALNFAARVGQFRGEARIAYERAEATITLSTEQGFTYWLAEGTILRGWALTELGQEEEGLAQMRRGLSAYGATGARLWQLYYLALMAEVDGKVGQIEVGVAELAAAFSLVERTQEHEHEAELYRLRGELTLQEAKQKATRGTTPRPLTPSIQAEAEACFLKATEIARQQQAKSLELRATTSLGRLWQQQGKVKEAHQRLSEVYSWFTEGFDTTDLQEAKALLDELA